MARAKSQPAKWKCIFLKLNTDISTPSIMYWLKKIFSRSYFENFKKNKNARKTPVLLSNADFQDYSWADLFWLKDELDTNLVSIKESISFYETLISEKRERYIIAIGSDDYLNSNEPDEFKAQYRDQKFLQIENSTNDLEEIFYNSSFLTLFAIFEGSMKRLCQCIENKIKSKVKHTDLLKDGNKDQFQQYLTLVFGMNQSNSIKYLSQIRPYRIIRNKIAHEKSNISQDDRSKIKSIKNLKMINNNHIQIDPPLLKDLTSIMKDYFYELLKEIDIKMVDYKS